jgi:hypothetical protein
VHYLEQFHPYSAFGPTKIFLTFKVILSFTVSQAPLHNPETWTEKRSESFNINYLNQSIYLFAQSKADDAVLPIYLRTYLPNRPTFARNGYQGET